jgi:hypothetical protein
MRNRTVLLLVVACAIGVSLGGCGKKSEKEKSTAEEFRIPDSLLAPLEGYNLTRDDYHPIEGGVMENAQIVLRYPASNVARYVAVKIFGFARDGYRKVTETIGKPADGKVVLIGSKDLDEYRFLTRKEWWYYGTVYGDTIYFEPFDIMIKRGIAEMGITQKLAQLALRRLSNGRIPLWLRESAASRFAGEGGVLKMQVEEFRLQNWDINPSPETLERDLALAELRPDTRIAFGAAYRMLENLLAFSTFDDVIRFARLLGEGSTLDDASREVFGYDYASLLDRVRVDRG